MQNQDLHNALALSFIAFIIVAFMARFLMRTDFELYGLSGVFQNGALLLVIYILAIDYVFGTRMTRELHKNHAIEFDWFNGFQWFKLAFSRDTPRAVKTEFQKMIILQSILMILLIIALSFLD